MPPLIFRHPSPVGPLTLVSDGSALIGVYFDQHRPGGPPAEAVVGADGVIERARTALDAYFAGRRRSFDLPLNPRGTPFQTRVWAALLRLGYGETTTYSALSAVIDRPEAVRAVAGAVARNPLSIFIPCHRVLGANGSLTGFAGGVARKRLLLDLEAGAPTLAL